jgi:hypothetical protein
MVIEEYKYTKNLGCEDIFEIKSPSFVEELVPEN